MHEGDGTRADTGIGPAERESSLVIYARTYHRTSREAAHALARGDSPWRMLMWVTGAGVLWLALGATSNALAAVAAAGSAVLALHLIRRGLNKVGTSELNEWKTVPGSVPPNGRIVCVGSPRELALLARRGEIQDRPFEPEAFAGAVSPHSTRVDRAIVWGGYVLSMATAVLFLLITREWFWVWVFAVPLADVYLLIMRRFRPSYYRLVPGRVDVLFESGDLPGRLASQSIDLRTPRVVVDLTQACVFVVESPAPGAEPRSTELPFGMVKDRYAFSHTVLLAAASSATPAPLPENALLG